MAEGEWRWTTFDALSGREVHDLLKLRMDVFVVEQACAFAEIDGRDPEALHLRRFVGGDLAGCLRLFAPQALEHRARIGRIATAAAHRDTGLGHAMMEEALRFCAERFPGAQVDLSAQAHLEGFYRRHGFLPVSKIYLEDDIPHLDMRRPAEPPKDHP
ncbi:GNAT family N-acetyltransferase [Jiella endophytica]|uniref:GNAT family N-acetyltransferase n=1 Tax=Jiella endophytica TaxID=2558362 RepID=A0A4Y8REC1_9HYPH|nr:GNAT family N-acetyltransferase [Jiella endophytica]TFF20635.1 GNAT family N-acetyltransferase [Jiella endophytica]TFF26936.1 GNAT family N-acetyltransferase [Jiella endophytica]